jgi:hypothetical protein
LIIDKQGFRQVVLTGLVLNLQDAIGRNFTMQIGSVIQSLTLVAGAEEIDTSPAVSTVVDQQFVQNMPLNGRSFQSLISLTPGFEFVGTSGAAGGTAPGQFSVNGQRSNANYFTVDGVSANFPVLSDYDLGQAVGGTTPALTVTGGTNGLLSVDAMQEFRVQTRALLRSTGIPRARRSLLSPGPAPMSFMGPATTTCATTLWTHAIILTSLRCPSRHFARMISGAPWEAQSSAIETSSSFPMKGSACWNQRRLQGIFLPLPRGPTWRRLSSRCWRPRRFLAVR